MLEEKKKTYAEETEIERKHPKKSDNAFVKALSSHRLRVASTRSSPGAFFDWAAAVWRRWGLTGWEGRRGNENPAADEKDGVKGQEPEEKISLTSRTCPTFAQLHNFLSGVSVWFSQAFFHSRLQPLHSSKVNTLATCFLFRRCSWFSWKSHNKNQ